MIEQNNNSLTISFPSPEAARAFHLFLQSLLQGPGSSEPPSALLPPSPQDSLEPRRSQHVVLTEERQEQLFNQRAQGLSARQRIQNAQTTLRDGVLPFSKPGEAPAPSGQTSPRMRGVFADGAAQPPALPAAVRPAESQAPTRSKLRPAASPPQ